MYVCLCMHTSMYVCRCVTKLDGTALVEVAVRVVHFAKDTGGDSAVSYTHPALRLSFVCRWLYIPVQISGVNK